MRASSRTCAGRGEHANERGRGTACGQPHRPRWPADAHAGPCRSTHPARPAGSPAPRSARAPPGHRPVLRRDRGTQSHGRAAAARCPAPRSCYASTAGSPRAPDAAHPSHTVPTVPSARRPSNQAPSPARFAPQRTGSSPLYEPCSHTQCRSPRVTRAKTDEGKEQTMATDALWRIATRLCARRPDRQASAWS